MPKEILLPEVAANFESGTIEAWLKKVGDRIEIGDVIVEVSTDKAVVEIEAEDAGVLGKILVPAGTEELMVNTPIAVLLFDNEILDDQPTLAGEEATTDGSAETIQTASVGASIESARSDSGTVDSEIDERILASPIARRIAQQLGVNLGAIEGNGPGNRIVLGDVEAAAAQQGLDRPSAMASIPATTMLERPPAGTYTEVPTGNVRQIIAQRLSAAKREIPHFYLTMDCELDRLLDAREQLNESAETTARVSVNDFFVKASAMALQDVPDANVGWSDRTIAKFNDINISIAVATSKGFITPVVRNADAKNLRAISTELKSLLAPGTPKFPP